LIESEYLTIERKRFIYGRISNPKIISGSNCSFCTAKRAEQFKYIEKLKRLKLKTIGVELLDKEIRGKNLNNMGNVLFGE